MFRAELHSGVKWRWRSSSPFLIIGSARCRAKPGATGRSGMRPLPGVGSTIRRPTAIAPWNLDNWAESSKGATLFDLLEAKFGAGSWHVYEDLAVALTKLVHWGDLKDKVGENYFRYLEGGEPFFKNFFHDCAAGSLPKYSFIEPHFINFFEDVMWHDDMHPSSFDSTLYSDGGPGSVLLGDRIVWKVYQAIRNSQSASGNNWQNTLLIITFDEHGGWLRSRSAAAGHARRTRLDSTPGQEKRASISIGWAFACRW